MNDQQHDHPKITTEQAVIMMYNATKSLLLPADSHAYLLKVVQEILSKIQQQEETTQ